MDFSENQSPQNRRLKTWPFRRRRTVNGSTNGKIDHKINYDSELDLTRHESLRSIFMTDSSKTIQISERDIFQDTTTLSMKTGYSEID
jgi:hypothetical protein